MRKHLCAITALVAALAVPAVASATTCTPTGFYRGIVNMTAAVINPTKPVTGKLDATGCNIGVYFGPGASGTVKNAEISGANYFGIVANDDDGVATVDVLNSSIHDIGETPHNGTQHGVAIYFRALSEIGSITGRIVGNNIFAYQKGGIVANGPGAQVNITDNIVTGDGHVTYIAQNGIQLGYGATGSVMRNEITGNSYVGYPGDGSASGGVLVVGGAWYGGDFTANVHIVDNTLVGNDVGVYLSNAEADGSAPTAPTNVKVVNNTVVNNECFNVSYQAAISVSGNNDKMINNKIMGIGYAVPCGLAVDADPAWANRPKVHANK